MEQSRAEGINEKIKSIQEAKLSDNSSADETPISVNEKGPSMKLKIGSLTPGLSSLIVGLLKKVVIPSIDGSTIEILRATDDDIQLLKDVGIPVEKIEE